MKFRCSITIPKTNRKCKCKSQFLQYKICYIHAKMVYEKPSIIIQRFWRMYKTRTKFLKIIQLPSDIQSHIHHFIHRDNKLCDSINKIITKRFNERDKIYNFPIRPPYVDAVDTYVLVHYLTIFVMDIAFKYRTILNKYNHFRYNHIYSTFASCGDRIKYYTCNAHEYRLKRIAYNQQNVNYM